MASRKDIIREYKERRHPAGVFAVRNTVSGKLLLGSSLNLEGSLNKHEFMLKIGSHRNTELQRDWKEHGADAFVFEILETVEVKAEPGFDLADELELLEEIWIEKLQPLGDNGYNTGRKIREA